MIFLESIGLNIEEQNNMQLDVQTIIQGGAVGISVLLIILIGAIIKWLFRFFGNHIDHNTKSNIGHTKSNQELIDVIRELKDFLMHNNGK